MMVEEIQLKLKELPGKFSDEGILDSSLERNYPFEQTSDLRYCKFRFLYLKSKKFQNHGESNFPLKDPNPIL